MADAPRAWVLHVDLDQFLAAVEVRRRPELRGLPVVVGGDGNPRRPRQVVATASYEARAFGVHSGMPLAQALRRCPDAVFLPSDRPAYDAASVEVMDTLRSFPAAVEVWGWDEAFMGATTADPRHLAADVQAAVRERTTLSCAVGIGDTRLLAKTATGWAKPGGIAMLTRAEWIPRLGAEPVTTIWGVGARTAARLAELGVFTVEDLARADTDALARAFGPTIGPHLRILGLGGDDVPIDPTPHVAKGRSREETFTTNVADPAEIAAHVERLAREVTASVVADGRRVTHVAVKVRTATFWTRTKISKLAGPTSDPATVAATARIVLDRFGELRPIRLLGVRVVLEPPADDGPNHALGRTDDDDEDIAATKDRTPTAGTGDTSDDDDDNPATTGPTPAADADDGNDDDNRAKKSPAAHVGDGKDDNPAMKAPAADVGDGNDDDSATTAAGADVTGR